MVVGGAPEPCLFVENMIKSTKFYRKDKCKNMREIIFIKDFENKICEIRSISSSEELSRVHDKELYEFNQKNPYIYASNYVVYNLEGNIVSMCFDNAKMSGLDVTTRCVFPVLS